MENFDPCKAWKMLSKETVYQPQDGRFLTVERHTVELPDGQQIDDWPWIITPDYVNVVAVTADGDFLCFRQTKYALDRVALAVVGGYMERGEEALAAAQRELLEETGYVAATLVAAWIIRLSTATAAAARPTSSWRRARAGRKPSTPMIWRSRNCSC